MYEYRCCLCGALNEANPEWRFDERLRKTHMTGSVWCSKCGEETVQNQTKQNLQK